VSGGEVASATAGGVPTENIAYHGNYKSATEIAEAVGIGIGRIVIDHVDEIPAVSTAAQRVGVVQDVWLRLNPTVFAGGHPKIRTALVSSKFGLSISTGVAEEAVIACTQSRNVRLVGYHFHLGSQIADASPFASAVQTTLDFASRMVERHHVEPREITVGGGFPVRYSPADPASDSKALAHQIASLFQAAAIAHELRPHLRVEPGRAIVARAGVALYRVGSTKRAGGRTVIAVDGGIGDNPRPALYGARYRPVAVHERPGERPIRVDIVGRYCEEGDVLARGVSIGPLRSGDLVAFPVSGAYQLSMASNYNGVPRPAVVVVDRGQAILVRRRETPADMLNCEIPVTLPSESVA
jgi:diaminopimelate decarboxylase